MKQAALTFTLMWSSPELSGTHAAGFSGSMIPICLIIGAFWYRTYRKIGIALGWPKFAELLPLCLIVPTTPLWFVSYPVTTAVVCSGLGLAAFVLLTRLVLASEFQKYGVHFKFVSLRSTKEIIDEAIKKRLHADTNPPPPIPKELYSGPA